MLLMALDFKSRQKKGDSFGLERLYGYILILQVSSNFMKKEFMICLAKVI